VASPRERTFERWRCVQIIRQNPPSSLDELGHPQRLHHLPLRVHQLSAIKHQPRACADHIYGGLCSSRHRSRARPNPAPSGPEHACIEQCAAWFLTRDKVGLEINWPKGGIYQRFSQLPLLPMVSAVLSRYQRFALA